MTPTEEIRKEAWNKALHAYGTYKIYSDKAEWNKKKLSFLTFLGIVVPLVVGAVAMGYGSKSGSLEKAIYLLTPLAIVQLVMSSLALVYRWDDNKSYYLESLTSNRELSHEFEKLAKFPPENAAQMQYAYDSLCSRESFRNAQDDKYPFTKKEDRKGMRYGLIQFQRTCAGCGKMPVSMTSTECDICGKF